MSGEPVLELKLFGPFQIGWSDGVPVDVTSAKARAMLAMLAILPDNTATRDFLQTHLWQLAGPVQGRGSLRQELTSLRRKLGARFEDLFDVDHERVRLRAERVRVTGTPAEGLFLDGVTVREPAFLNWRQGVDAQRPAAQAARATVRPRVAVLPFVETVDNRSSGVLGDLIANEIMRAISRTTHMEVISHLSSRRIDPRRTSVDEVRRRLSADYLMQGHVRPQGERVRLDADLIELTSGRLVWSHEVGDSLRDILAGQSALPQALAQLTAQAVLRHSIKTTRTKPLAQIESHALFMSAIEQMHSHELVPFAQSRAMLEALVERAPRETVLMAWLAKWYALAMTQGISSDPARDQQFAADLAARALDIDPFCETSLAIDGMIQGDMGHLDIARIRHDEATRVNPNNALGWLMHSRTHAYQNHGPEAVRMAERARGLSPLDPQRYYFEILYAMALAVDGQHARAVEMAKRAIDSNPHHISSYRTLCCAQVRVGDMTSARRTLARLRRLAPELTVSQYLRSHPAGSSPLIRNVAADLRAAGLPE